MYVPPSRRWLPTKFNFQKQADLEERGAQVPLMNRIFAAAQSVFAWVGEFDILRHALFTVVPTICEVIESGEPWIPDHATLEDIAEKRADLYVLTILLSRRWFRRAWVVQEAVYARRLYIWSGPFFLDWWKMIPAIRVLQEGDHIMDIVTLMGSLIRREPKSRQCRLFNRAHSGKEIVQPVPGVVTDEELLGLVEGAVAFIDGVVEIKRSLGLPSYLPIARRQPTPPSGPLPSRNTSPQQTTVGSSAEGDSHLSKGENTTSSDAVEQSVTKHGPSIKLGPSSAPFETPSKVVKPDRQKWFHPWELFEP